MNLKAIILTTAALAAVMLAVLVVWKVVSPLNPFQTAVERAELARVEADLQAISVGLKTYKMLNGFFPSPSQGLDALVTKPSGDPVPRKWLQIMTEVPLDPWGNAYRYKLPGTHNPKSFDLYSTGGPHGKAIGNW
jgi:general secretion pathway protein G